MQERFFNNIQPISVGVRSKVTKRSLFAWIVEVRNLERS